MRAREGRARTYRFFAGKGGVGKTTCAAAAALARAEALEAEKSEHAGPVLVGSTDPAHSLGDALGRKLGPEPRPVPLLKRPGALWAVEISGERAFSRWLAPRQGSLRAAALRGTYLDEEDVDRILALKPPGVDEIAALSDLERAAEETGCGEVVVDTAPTAHTLRLVATPEVLTRIAGLLDELQEKHRLLSRRFGGAYTPDEVDAALAGIAEEGRGLGELLVDRERTRFAWILLPEALSLAEARDGVAALAAVGIEVAELIVNRVTPAGGLCASCRARRRAELAVIAEAEAAFPGRLRLLPAFAREPRGVAGLRRVAAALGDRKRGRGLLAERTDTDGGTDDGTDEGTDGEGGQPDWPGLLAPLGARLLLFGGKGGVGKTTCAATAALALARERPGERLLLLSTDPAHSLGDVLKVPLGDEPRQIPGGPENLWARELDASQALSRWSAGKREAVEGLLDAFFGAAAGEGPDLSHLEARFSGVTPGGLDELAAIAILAEAVLGEEEERYDLVIVDLAPTGHALRLLEMPALALAWDRALLAILLKYREAVRPGALASELVALSRTLHRLTELLADPRRTRFVAVARAAELPRRGTARLLAALARLQIGVAALLVNAVPRGRCARCRPTAAETRELARLESLAPSGSAILLAPALYPPPRGQAALAGWGRTWREGGSLPPGRGWVGSGGRPGGGLLVLP